MACHRPPKHPRQQAAAIPERRQAAALPERAGHQIELSGAQLQFVQAAADLRRAEDALQKAKKRLADAQRAQSAAQKNMQKVLASQAMPAPVPQH